MKPDSIGIDTWAIDFVLLDKYDQPLTEAVSYRDPRTAGMMEEVFKVIEKDQLYLETGIQFLTFNTIYQLEALKRSRPEVLTRAKTFLMIPDYFNYLLTGKNQMNIPTQPPRSWSMPFQKIGTLASSESLELIRRYSRKSCLQEQFLGN